MPAPLFSRARRLAAIPLLALGVAGVAPHPARAHGLVAGDTAAPAVRRAAAPAAEPTATPAPPPEAEEITQIVTLVARALARQLAPPAPAAPAPTPDAPVPTPDAPVPAPDAPLPTPDAPLPAPDAPVATAVDVAANAPGLGGAVLRGLLAERARAGAPAVAWDATVAAAAQQRADAMAAQGVLSHYEPNGGTIFTRLNGVGAAWAYAGEVIARNNYPLDQTADVATAAYLASPPHRAVIVDPQYDVVGVGHAVDAQGMHYYAVVFVRR